MASTEEDKDKKESLNKEEALRMRRPPTVPPPPPPPTTGTGTNRRPENKKYGSIDEYFVDLEKWMSEAYFWYGVTAAFPYYLALTTSTSTTTTATASPTPTTTTTQASAAPPQNRPTTTAPPANLSWDGVECRIPSLWKRVAAEAIDFLILFFLKLAMTFIAVDFFDIVDLDKFDFVTFQKDTKLEYKVLLQVTHDIIILELVHRIVVCIFEAFWLQGGSNGRVGGATPGKSMMGLRVITCHSSLTVTPRAGSNNNNAGNNNNNSNVVFVRPGRNLGLGASLARALVKNIVMTFLIPAGFAFLYFRHNRTGYDMICNTIVVEEPLILRAQHPPNNNNN